MKVLVLSLDPQDGIWVRVSHSDKNGEIGKWDIAYIPINSNVEIYVYR